MVEKPKNLKKKNHSSSILQSSVSTVCSVHRLRTHCTVFTVPTVTMLNIWYSVNSVSSVNITLLLRCVYNIFSAYMLCYAFSVYRMLISDKPTSPTITHTETCEVCTAGTILTV